MLMKAHVEKIVTLATASRPVLQLPLVRCQLLMRQHPSCPISAGEKCWSNRPSRSCKLSVINGLLTRCSALLLVPKAVSRLLTSVGPQTSPRWLGVAKRDWEMLTLHCNPTVYLINATVRRTQTAFCDLVRRSITTENRLGAAGLGSAGQSEESPR
jgi:hypothetical protein